MTDRAVISQRGAQRWTHGHPWIFRSDVVHRPEAPAGAVTVADQRGQPLGIALWSPASEISLRFVSRDAEAMLDRRWWIERLGAALRRRAPLQELSNAYRIVHGEADGIPSLVCDRYDRWLVVQLMSAGLEAFRTTIVDCLLELTGALGVLARNDAAVRAREGLDRQTELLSGDVPQEVEVLEHGVRYLAAPWTGQKTGAFLDQRENRVLSGEVAHGQALDCFSYHGSFALHLARRAEHVTAVDVSAKALARARENVERNGFRNVSLVEADAFDFLRQEERRGMRYHTIVLDPPAFAKSRGALESALRGYKDINLHGMRLLAPGGVLFTASCSYHLSKPLFLEMLAAAAADSGRRMALRRVVTQPLDHPELLTVPETGYIKGALLEALD